MLHAIAEGPKTPKTPTQNFSYPFLHLKPAEWSMPRWFAAVDRLATSAISHLIEAAVVTDAPLITSLQAGLPQMPVPERNDAFAATGIINDAYWVELYALADAQDDDNVPAFPRLAEGTVARG